MECSWYGKTCGPCPPLTVSAPGNTLRISGNASVAVYQSCLRRVHANLTDINSYHLIQFTVTDAGQPPSSHQSGKKILEAFPRDDTACAALSKCNVSACNQFASATCLWCPFAAPPMTSAAVDLCSDLALGGGVWSVRQQNLRRCLRGRESCLPPTHCRVHLRYDACLRQPRRAQHGCRVRQTGTVQQ